jgi:hypothetical protein
VPEWRGGIEPYIDLTTRDRATGHLSASLVARPGGGGGCCPPK